ncbi:hypothetical protein ACHAQJ_000387 [Trichoderma viride]
MLRAFDHLGGIVSARFNVNQDPLEFVTVVLGFLWMNSEQLGHDPTFITSGTSAYIEIQREGRTERLVLDKVIFSQSCIVGRATTCWKAHREDGGLERTLVVKDSWQYPERNEEGLMLQEASLKRVENMDTIITRSSK